MCDNIYTNFFSFHNALKLIYEPLTLNIVNYKSLNHLSVTIICVYALNRKKHLPVLTTWHVSKLRYRAGAPKIETSFTSPNHPLNYRWQMNTTAEL